MGPTFSDVVKMLDAILWTPLRGEYARVARAGILTGRVEMYCVLGGSDFFRLTGRSALQEGE